MTNTFRLCFELIFQLHYIHKIVDNMKLDDMFCKHKSQNSKNFLPSNKSCQRNP